MSKYLYTKRMFRNMTSNDIESVLVGLRLELQITEAMSKTVEEQIEAAEQILKERK